MDTKSFRGEYQKKGYIIYRGFISHAEASKLSDYVDQYVRMHGHSLSGREINWLDSKSKIVNSVHKTDLDDESPVVTMLHSEKLQNIVRLLINGEIKARCAEFFCKPAKFGLASPMHQDNYYWCLEPADALTVWLSLTGADQDNGGLAYYPGSHRLGDLPHVPSLAPGSSQKVHPDLLPPENEIEIPSLDPGDILLHHAMVIHGSAPNCSARERKGITFQYQSVRCQLNNERQEIYHQSLQDQVNDRACDREVVNAGV